MSGRGAAHELPFALVTAGVIVGFALFQKHHPISGSVALGGSFVLGALMRSTFSDRAAGLLAVRGRTLDAAVLGTIGIAIIGLALSLRKTSR